MDYGCGSKAKLLNRLQNKLRAAAAAESIPLSPAATDAAEVVFVGADPCLEQRGSQVAADASAAEVSSSSALPLEQTAAAGTSAEKGAVVLQLDKQPHQLQNHGVILSNSCSWAVEGAGGRAAARYDVVLCSLVLCVLPDRQQYLAVLDDLAAAVKPGACVGGWGCHGPLSNCDTTLSQNGQKSNTAAVIN